jgi:CRISPR-associated endonuclease/helicase Cas3
MDRLLLLWGKKKGEPEVRYPLLGHMLDVALVVREMWDTCLHSHLKRFLSRQIELSEEEAGACFSWWAGLHDLGKASPAFQSKSAAAREGLEAEGFGFHGYDPSQPHGAVTASALTHLLKEKCSPRVSSQIATAVGGHHGVFPRSEDVLHAVALEDSSWNSARCELKERLILALRMKKEPRIERSPKPAFFMCLAGLTAVADWIGSNDEFFPVDRNLPTDHDIVARREMAQCALENLGWTGWAPASTRAPFGEMFPFIRARRPLQEEAIRLADLLSQQPGLVIVEAPTGEGKTEAALYLTESWIARLGQQGAYVALPTQATSNQMFGRVVDFAQNCYPGRTVNLQLLHGQASLSAEFEVLKRRHHSLFRPTDIWDDATTPRYDGVSPTIVAAEWFTHRKRGLLAPLGVGTIDQALLAVLQAKHVFVRLFGLAGKIVIFDEVHAYDAYMTELLERLVEWLASLSSSVVLLSATLPKQRRTQLLEAYQRGQTSGDSRIRPSPDAPYPRISWVSGGDSGTRPIQTSPLSARVLNLEWIEGFPTEGTVTPSLGARLHSLLRRGGCAAVICNTVDRAQEVYRALKPEFPNTALDGHQEIDLLHARFLFGERSSREKRTLLRFGKHGSRLTFDDGTEHAVQRPHRAVLVATQIIEQSLDLDFDLMVTEMAPADLLLQRAGRLQRHLQLRPECFEGHSPCLWICAPRLVDGVPDFSGGTTAVYDTHVLLRSWLALRKRSEIRVPDDVEDLVESVYSDQPTPQGLCESLAHRWQQTLQEQKLVLDEHRRQAEERRIKAPSYGGAIWRMTYEPREEDDPDLHPTHQALTRLAAPSVSAVCLHSKDGALYLDPACHHRVDTDIPPTMEVAKALLMRSICLSHKGLVSSLTQGQWLVPEPWRENPLLRHHYLLSFSERSTCTIGPHRVRLDPELGLVTERDKA